MFIEIWALIKINTVNYFVMIVIGVGIIFNYCSRILRKECECKFMVKQMK